ncbi:MAG: aminomethyl-transferring glycine dehydrogenase subunit GcvPA [Chloroflexi bacterium]|nr:aminomethyl-transferring glycine dehydrogenase subunit GcvPA [Chloroflexota bacterium]
MGMAYVPHTATDRAEMLALIGAASCEALFESIPEECRYPKVTLPEPVSEMEMLAELRALGRRNTSVLDRPCFLGAGAYNHYVPSVVPHLTGRSEFYTAYTPYQPEISQGTLQAVFEYQTMICALTGMEVSNASHYDGATALAEAIIMALGIARGKKRKAIVSQDVHPEYRAVARTYTQGMDVVIIGDDKPATLEELLAQLDEETACLVLQTPDFFGRIHDLTGVADRVHRHGAQLVVACDPISLGMLMPPGAMGADIVVGEGQPLGIGLQFGGPYLGFSACRKADVRRMAGRVVGETVDIAGERGYVLTLATREQHIRREKATSNICSNQGLNVLAAAIYLSALGRCGLARVAELCYQRAHYAAATIDALPGYQVDGALPFFKEFVVHCPAPAREINRALLAKHGIIGGYDLGQLSPARENQMLLCVTEMNTASQIDHLAQALREVAG